MKYEVVKDSGLRMTVLNQTPGPKPVVGQTVSIHYEIWLGDGTMTSNYDYDNDEYIHDIYDSTYDERSPFSGPIDITVGEKTPKDEIYTKGQSIAGIDEALLGMGVGSKVALLIPPDLAYGNEGASSFHTFHGYRTPPNQALRCNVELVAIKNSNSSDDRSIEDEPENVAYEG